MFSGISTIGFALTAAFLFALGSQFQHLGLSSVGTRGAATISISASAAFLWLLAPFLLDGAHFSHPSVLIFVLVGLFRPAVSANLSVAGLRHLGPTLSTTLSATAPLFGAVFGIAWLGESLTGPIALGTAGIIAAIVMLARGDTRASATWPLWTLGLPIGAAAARSVGHVLSKVGMEGIPDPYFAALVTFSVSTVIVIAVQRVRPSPHPVEWRGRGPYLFAAAGVLYAIAVLSLNAALMRGQIVTVVPVVASAPIFTMLLSILFFRRERLSPRIVAAAFVVVPSVILIALKP